MHQAGWLGQSQQFGVTGPGACLQHPSGTSYIECQVALRSSYVGWEDRVRGSHLLMALGEETGLMTTWRSTDRFIWSQTAKCTDICKWPSLAWGSVNAGDLVPESLAWKNISHQCHRLLQITFYMRFWDTTYSAWIWTEHQNSSFKPSFLSLLKDPYYHY